MLIMIHKKRWLLLVYICVVAEIVNSVGGFQLVRGR